MRSRSGMDGLRDVLGGAPVTAQAELSFLPPRETQDDNLERVATKIAPLVMEFCRQIWADAKRSLPQFHAVELTAFVRRRMDGLAPDSAGRILRELRKRGRVDYKIVSRRDSLYQLMAVAA